MANPVNKDILLETSKKKAKEQIKTFGLDEWIIEPKLDEVNRPVDFDVQYAMKLFINFKNKFSEIKKHIESIKFPTIMEHINKICQKITTYFIIKHLLSFIY